MEGVILMGAPVSCRPGPVWLKGLRSCPNPRTAGGSLATRGHYFSQFRSGNECLDPSREPVVGFWVGSSCSLSECSRTFQSRAKLCVNAWGMGAASRVLLLWPCLLFNPLTSLLGFAYGFPGVRLLGTLPPPLAQQNPRNLACLTL